MATLPIDAESIIAKYGPSLHLPEREGISGKDEPDKVVETHCCFCGMQCGIKLLAKNNKVVGFEPWMEFPFNEGRLCPKGVLRYMQNNHHDRLASPLQSKPGVGFEPVSWDQAMDTTLSEIKRIQSKTIVWFLP